MPARYWIGLTLGVALHAAAQDTLSDTWAAADALGRELPCEGQAPAARTNRFVGVFYYLWQGAHGYDRHGGPTGPEQEVGVPGPGDTNSPYNISEIIRAPPGERNWGPRHAFHHWGEPLFGYYVANDDWVIRKHAQMLADAGVDAIIFDVTNGFSYRAIYLNVLRVYAEIRAAGGRTPAVSFLTNSAHGTVVRQLYADLYAKRLYKELWFVWKGKPLLLASSENLTDEIKAFFTLRQSWAWTNNKGWFGDGKDRWPWLDHTPQNYGWHESPDKPEQIVVSTAEHPDSDRGKSFHDGANPKPHRSGQGLYFAEQWRRALDVDPEFVFITQWNEWIAMRFTKKDINRPSYAGEKDYDPEGVFVDLYNMEYNRDIEPMKGGYGDNYYYQMWQNIRRFKGVRPLPPASAEVADSWEGGNSAARGDARLPLSAQKPQGERPREPQAGAGVWAAVAPAYLDDAGDTFHRNHFGYGSAGTLTNATGRNDIRLCKVARSPQTLWFMAEAAQPLTPPAGDAWMTLYIAIEGDASRPAWQGFSFKVQPEAGGQRAQVFARTATQTWQAQAAVSCVADGNRVVVTLPRPALGLKAGGPLRLRFKWSDNVRGGDPLAWWTDGDTAPNGRAAYRYHAD
jgi:hypothetical protein